MSFLKVVELGVAALLLGWRLLAQPPERWALDAALVLVLLWIAFILGEGRPGFRGWLTAAASAWLLVIYSIHQGPHTFGLFAS